jgi:hypothetical protein
MSSSLWSSRLRLMEQQPQEVKLRQQQCLMQNESNSRGAAAHGAAATEYGSSIPRSSSYGSSSQETAATGEAASETVFLGNCKLRNNSSLFLHMYMSKYRLIDYKYRTP